MQMIFFFQMYSLLKCLTRVHKVEAGGGEDAQEVLQAEGCSMQGGSSGGELYLAGGSMWPGGAVVVRHSRRWALELGGGRVSWRRVSGRGHKPEGAYHASCAAN